VKQYYSMSAGEDTAEIYIFGEITSWPLEESDVSSYLLSRQIEGADVKEINVYINSYGGEVAEAVAIYNTLRRHPAKVRTFCEGFACSAASVIFMAGEERVMERASLLMVHNAWTQAGGNASELRKAADDLEKINDTVAGIYRDAVSISGEELQSLLDNETWISPEEAVRMGFATAIAGETSSPGRAAADAKGTLFRMLLEKPKELKERDMRKFIAALAAERTGK